MNSLIPSRATMYAYILTSTSFLIVFYQKSLIKLFQSIVFPEIYTCTELILYTSCRKMFMCCVLLYVYMTSNIWSCMFIFWPLFRVFKLVTCVSQEETDFFFWKPSYLKSLYAYAKFWGTLWRTAKLLTILEFQLK